MHRRNRNRSHIHSHNHNPISLSSAQLTDEPMDNEPEYGNAMKT